MSHEIVDCSDVVVNHLATSKTAHELAAMNVALTRQLASLEEEIARREAIISGAIEKLKELG